MTHSSAQSRILCFDESDAVNIYNPSSTYTATKTLVSASLTLVPTNTIRPTSTTIRLDSPTPFPFPSSITAIVTQVATWQPLGTNELFESATNFAQAQTQTPGFNANTAIAQTATAFVSPTSEKFISLVGFNVVVNAGVRVRLCNNQPFSTTCPLAPASNWLQAGNIYFVDVSQTWCARGILSGVEYYFVLTNMGWAAWKSTNGQLVYLQPNVPLVC